MPVSDSIISHHCQAEHRQVSGAPVVADGGRRPHKDSEAIWRPKFLEGGPALSVLSNQRVRSFVQALLDNKLNKQVIKTMRNKMKQKIKNTDN